MDIELEPEKAGFAPDRLDRLDRHFARYVDDGLLAGWQVAITRDGKLVHHTTYGLRDREAGLAVEPDTIWRIYSMTKPLTSVAAMMLYEQGRLALRQPIAEILPEFADARVYQLGSALNPATVPAEPILVWHLLTHTSGMTYGFLHQHPMDEMHRLMDVEFFPPDDFSLADAVQRWATVPLLFQPGTGWNYGVSTDVLGRVVEVVAGKPLGEVLAERVYGPLKMSDTTFLVPADKSGRVAQALPAHPDTGAPYPLADPTKPRKFDCGGGCAVSTAGDYARFAQMLLNRGTLDGVRVLAPKTVQLMTADHLGPIARGPVYYAGPGYTWGLGLAVRQENGLSPLAGSAGDFFWPGAYATYWWADPKAELVVVSMLQSPLGRHYQELLRALVNQAIVE
jgi:CubicO group peptidase (beta-lactamase class C family)